MDSSQSVVSPFKSSSQQIGNAFVENTSILSRETKSQGKEAEEGNSDGSLDVYIHQARDIHNICIYQNQDVYAKLYLTSDPDKAVSTKIINGGGRNPIFNEGVRLDACKADSSLKCEIWMLSRVQNYLKDQLLGFALVPVSQVLLHNGKLEKELSLSSSDLFHSPAGFVRLSISYDGTPPEVIPIPASVETDSIQDTDSAKSIQDDLDKIEFPDPKVVNENCQMVEEYITIPCANLDSQCSDSIVGSDTENQVSSGVEAQRADSFSIGTETAKIDSPPSSVSTNGTSSASGSAPGSSEFSETPKDFTSPDEGHVFAPKDHSKKDNASGLDDAKSNVSGEMSSNTFLKPIVTVNIESESKVVQQDIVDMYMKSMQQFTESLAKMKLPMDFESSPMSSENSSSDQKSPASKNSGSRVFYGSRAFF